MSKFTTQRNFGFGKQMDWAGHHALKDIYGRGHFGTVASHAQRWRQFCHWARSIHGINDACAIDQSLLESYAADLAERVEDETLAVSYAQNLIVSANITLEAMRQDKTIRIESPASYVEVEPDRVRDLRVNITAPGNVLKAENTSITILATDVDNGEVLSVGEHFFAPK